MLASAHAPMPLWIWGVILVVFGVAMWQGIVQNRRAAANLRALAQRLGLDCVADDNQPGGANLLVTGRLEGRDVSFFNFTTGSGKSRVTWRAVSVRPRASGGLTFHFQRQSLATKLRELFGAHEIVTGDAPFDAAWFLETNEPEFLRAALVPEVRAKLMAAPTSSGGNFKLETVTVCYAERGTFADANACTRFEQMLPVLHDLADLAEVSAERGP